MRDLTAKKQVLGNGRIAYVHVIDSMGGMTQDMKDGRTSIVYAPAPTNAYNRTVLRHELLHAEFDSTYRGALGYNRERDEATDKLPDMIDGQTVSGVDDAFVQLKYWPAGEDVQADTEAVRTALDELTGISGETNDSANNRGVILRGLAILRKLGTTTERALGRLSAAQLIGAKGVEQLEAILDLVVRGKRYEAYIALANMNATLRPGGNSMASIEYDIARSMGRENRMSLWARV